MGTNAEIDFRMRVSPRTLPELMDGDCSYEDFLACLRSLEQINRLLFGYRPTLDWLSRLPLALRDHALADNGLPDPVYIPCTFSTWAVAAAICCGKLHTGRGSTALLSSSRESI